MAVSNFLGNATSPPFQEEVENLLKADEEMGCRTSLKVLFRHSHLDFSQQTLVLSVMSEANDIIRIYKQWRNATTVFGMKE